VASVVDICNLALAHLGNEATVSSISPPDGSVEAMHCARFYPIARDALLEPHAWHFALRRATLNPLATSETPPSWVAAFALPNGCLRPLRVLLPGAVDDTAGEEFTVETLSDGTKVLFTVAEEASLVFIAAVSDTTRFTPLFAAALARMLASYLAGPLIKGKAGGQVAAAQYEFFVKVELPAGLRSDASGRKVSVYENHVPGALAARR